MRAARQRFRSNPKRPQLVSGADCEPPNPRTMRTNDKARRASMLEQAQELAARGHQPLMIEATAQCICLHLHCRCFSLSGSRCENRVVLVRRWETKLMMIVPDAITLARAGAITGLLWVSWTALSRWRRW